MSKLRVTLNLLTVLAITFVCVSFAQAQATRTWVSGVGDDANPCSRTAPCKTFGTAKASIDGTSMTNNRVGVNVGERAQVFVRDSQAIGNQSVGLPVGFNIGGSTSSTMFLENCTAAHNNSGIRGLGTGGTEQIFLSNCDIYDTNNAGVNMASFTQAVSYQNNRITANTLDIAGTFINASPGQRLSLSYSGPGTLTQSLQA
jgi:hypothetical protein